MILKKTAYLYYIIFLMISLFLNSCSEEDDSLLKESKVAKSISEADQLNSPLVNLSINDDLASTNNLNVSIKISGSDAVNLTGFFITNEDEIPSSESSGWIEIKNSKKHTESRDYTLSAIEKNHTYYGFMKDGAGNISNKASASIIYDVTKPIISSFNINSNSSSTSSTIVNLYFSGSDELSGIKGYYLSESSLTPSSTASGWQEISSLKTISTSTQFNLSNPGSPGTFTKTIYIWLIDEAGNISNRSSDSIDLTVKDQSAPTNPSITINNGSTFTTTAEINLRISASDDVGVTGYYLSTSSSKPNGSEGSWKSINSNQSFSQNISYTLSSYGTKTLYVWFIDSSGNISERASDSINFLDSEKPKNPSISINSGANSTTSSSVSLALSASDNSGVTGYYLSQNSSTPSSTASGWISVNSTTSYSASVGHTISGSGTVTLYVWFKDQSGNVSSSANDSIQLDIQETQCNSSNVFSVVLANIDDKATVSVNDNSVISKSFGSSTQQTDITSHLKNGQNKIVFELTNNSSGYTYTYQLKKDSSYLLNESCGNFNVSGCNNDSHETGIVYRKEYIVNCTGIDSESPSNPGVLINNGDSSTNSSSVSLKLSATDNTGITGYYLSGSSNTPSASVSGWNSVSSTTSYSATVSYTLSGSSGTQTVYVWYKDASGNVSSAASDSITLNSSSGGTISGGSTAFSPTIVNGNTLYRTSVSYSEYFKFGASSGTTYTINFASTSSVQFYVYKGVGNLHASKSYSTSNSITVSGYSGDVIIKFYAENKEKKLGKKKNLDSCVISIAHNFSCPPPKLTT